MDLINLFIAYLLVFSLWVLGKRIIASQDDWKKQLLTIGVNVAMLIVFLTIRPSTTTFLRDMSDSLLMSYVNSPLTILYFCIGAVVVTYITWYFVDREIVKPAPGNERFWLAIGVVGTSLCTLYIFLKQVGVKEILSSYNDLLYGFCATILVIVSIIFAKYKSQLQNAFAIPLGAVIVTLLSALTIWDYFGINILNKFFSDGEKLLSGGAIAKGEAVFIAPLVFIAVALIFSTIWHKSKEWNQRLTYRILSLAIWCLIGNACFISGMYMIGANDSQVKGAIHTKNRLAEGRFELEKKMSKAVPRNGLTYDEANTISLNTAKFDLKTLEKAGKSAEQHEAALMEISRKYEGLQVGMDTQKGKEFLKSRKEKGSNLWNSAKGKFFGPDSSSDDIEEPRPLGSFTQSQSTPTKTLTFTGIGYTGGIDGKGGIGVLMNTKDVVFGQHVKVNGAETYYGGKYQAISSFTNKAEDVDYIAMRAPQGVQFTISL